MGCIVASASRVGSNITVTANAVDNISVHVCCSAPILCFRVHQICDITIGWEEFVAADGAFMTAEGQPFLGKIILS